MVETQIKSRIKLASYVDNNDESLLWFASVTVYGKRKHKPNWYLKKNEKDYLNGKINVWYLRFSKIVADNIDSEIRLPKGWIKRETKRLLGTTQN